MFLKKTPALLCAVLVSSAALTAATDILSSLPALREEDKQQLAIFKAQEEIKRQLDAQASATRRTEELEIHKAKQEQELQAKKDAEEKEMCEHTVLMPHRAYKWMKDHTWSWVPIITFYCARNLQYSMVYSVTEGVRMMYNKLMENTIGKATAYFEGVMWDPEFVVSSSAPQGMHLDNMILEPEVRTELEVALKTFNDTVESGGAGNFVGLLFYGPSGTGKTECAKALASMANARFFEVDGVKLAQAKNDEIMRLMRKLEWRKTPTIVLIDECETLLESRAIGSGNPAINEWLNKTSKPHPYIQFIYATNYRWKIDEAMERRFRPIEFKLPSAENRGKLFELYFERLFLSDERYSAEQRAWMEATFTPEYFAECGKKLVLPKGDMAITNDTFRARVGGIVGAVNVIGDSLEVFTPSLIENLMIAVKNKSALAEGGLPTIELLDQQIQADIAGKVEGLRLEAIREANLLADRRKAQR